MNIRSTRSITVAGLVALIPIFAPAKAGTEKESIAHAHQLVNDYYGDSRNLAEAASVIAEVLRKNPSAADAYVEAARIAAKGGHIVSDQFQSGTQDLYQNLIDKALSLDPENVTALALRAQIYLMAGNTADAFTTIQRGLELSPKEPWLQVELAEYYRRKKEAGKALGIYNTILGGHECESNAEYGRACLVALMAQIELFNSFPSNADIVRALAKRAGALRHPRDAWTLGELGRYFAEMDLLDESIEYSRHALKVMNFGVGRLNLAVALYTKAVLLGEQGESNLKYLQEADRLQVSEEEVLGWFVSATPVAKAHAPAVRAMFERRATRTKSRGSKGDTSRRL